MAVHDDAVGAEINLKTDLPFFVCYCVPMSVYITQLSVVTPNFCSTGHMS